MPTARLILVVVLDLLVEDLHVGVDLIVLVLRVLVEHALSEVAHAELIQVLHL